MCGEGVVRGQGCAGERAIVWCWLSSFAGLLLSIQIRDRWGRPRKSAVATERSVKLEDRGRRLAIHIEEAASLAPTPSHVLALPAPSAPHRDNFGRLSACLHAMVNGDNSKDQTYRRLPLVLDL